MADWNAKQYLQFATERTQPAIDLVNRITIDNPTSIIDIGCGPGNSTAILAKRYPQAQVLGIDSSPDMIETAKKEHPELSFALCDASNELNRYQKQFDIVFSNACLQWIPNHPKLLQDMMGLLKEGGVMAVQIPMNDKEPIHQIIGQVATNEKWCNKFNQSPIFHTLKQNQYFDVLSKITSDFTLWETTYFHKMKSHHAIMEWYRATGLRPYLDSLNTADKTEFEQDIYQELLKAYPKQANGEIIFRFPRFFFTAVK